MLNDPELIIHLRRFQDGFSAVVQRPNELPHKAFGPTPTTAVDRLLAGPDVILDLIGLNTNYELERIITRAKQLATFSYENQTGTFSAKEVMVLADEISRLKKEQA